MYFHTFCVGMRSFVGMLCLNPEAMMVNLIPRPVQTVLFPVNVFKIPIELWGRKYLWSTADVCYFRVPKYFVSIKVLLGHTIYIIFGQIFAGLSFGQSTSWVYKS